MKKLPNILILLFVICNLTNAQTITVNIDAIAGRKAISPYIFGRNNSLSDDPGSALSASDWQLFRDAGVKMFRENGGNNATKYNWREKLSSHPDWYNNVYNHNWDYASQSLQNNMPGSAAMWAFQLIGYAAANTDNNFDDWSYNASEYWPGVAQNLAGGGVIDTDWNSTEALTDGNPNLYLYSWPADSTAGILLHWFGETGLGLNPAKFRYWDMDNEPEIWEGTHDDVMPDQVSAEEFMQHYFAVAKKARAIFPGIKLMGPVTCNEWQWFNYSDDRIDYNGNSYSWLEYFILRIGEEQKASGVKLLDILDLHFYPGESDAGDVVQLHRIFFDKTYDYPGANGIKTLNGGWDESITREYVFERCREWLTKYIGENHGVTFSISEMDINNYDPNVVAVWYASTLGTFANEGVEVFTPWSWQTGMWETLHLFSRYGKSVKVQSISTDETSVSGYSSINYAADSMTVILVNRSTSETISTTVNLSNFNASNKNYSVLRINDLPENETFISHSNNDLQSASVALSDNSFSISLPPLSVTAVILTGSSTPVEEPSEDPDLEINPIRNVFDKSSHILKLNYNESGITEISYYLEKPMSVQIDLYDIQGKKIKSIENRLMPQGDQTVLLDNLNINPGVYILTYKAGSQTDRHKLVLF